MLRRSWTWLGLLGVLFGIAVAIFTGIEAALNPFNTSSFDLAWTLFYSCLFLAIGLLCWPWRGRLLIVLSVVATTILVLIAIVCAGMGPALFILIWLLCISAGLGRKTFKLLAPSLKIDSFAGLILSTSLGMGEMALLTLGLAAFHFLYPLVAYGVLVCLTILVVPGLVRSSPPIIVPLFLQIREAWRKADLRLPAVILSSLSVCLLGGLLWAIAPSIHYDALNYHLGVPALYVQYHGLIEVTEEFRSYWAHNAEMLYTLGLALIGQPLPALIHLTFGLLTTGLVFSLGRRIGGTRVGLFAAILFYSVPLVTWESGTAYIDLIVTLYTFGTVYCMVLWWQEQNDIWLTIAGTLAGFGLGTKLNSMVLLVPLSLILTCALLFRAGSVRRRLMSLLHFAIPVLLLVAPWLIRDWLWTGNPIFPFYNAFFRSPKWLLENTFFNFDVFGMGYGILDFLRLPWDLIVNTRAFAEATPPAVLGGLPLLALPWLYMWWPRSSRHLLSVGLALVLGVVAIWFKVGQYIRYLLPILPLFAILMAFNVEALWIRFSGSFWPRQTTVLGLLIVLAYIGGTRLVHVSTGWQIPDRYPYRLALGLQTPEAFLSDAVPVYDALQFLNQEGEDKHKVLSLGNELRMYTTSRVFGLGGSGEARLFASSLQPGPNLTHTVSGWSYDFLLVDQNQVKARPELSQLPVLQESFLRQFARLEFARHNIYVYRLLPYGSKDAAVELDNLLTNSGFEEIDPQGSPVAWFAYGHPVIDHSGARAHSGQVAVQSGGQAGFFQRVVVEPGKLYGLAHWTRADSVGQFARLQINWLDEDLSIVDVSIDVIPISSEWQWHKMQVTAPNDAVFAQVYVSIHDDSQVWFDDLDFVEGELYGWR